MKMVLIGLCIVVGVMAAAPAFSFECRVCHSKNPGMVKMHSEPRNRACFRCHAPGVIETKENIPLQMVSDPICRECHGR